MTTALASVQDIFLGVKAIEGGCIVLPDGSLRGILAVGSISLTMLSPQEQRALVGGYYQALMPLTYDLQITIAVERLDLTPYLEELEERARREPSPLLAQLARDHSADLRLQARDKALLQRSFYVTIPAGTEAAPAGGPLAFLAALFGRTTPVAERGLAHLRRVLDFRCEEQAAALARRCGLQSERLGTQELVELLYSWWARDLAARQRLRPLGEYATLAVRGAVAAATLSGGVEDVGMSLPAGAALPPRQSPLAPLPPAAGRGQPVVPPSASAAHGRARTHTTGHAPGGSRPAARPRRLGADDLGTGRSRRR